MSQSRPHLVKHAGRRAHSLYTNTFHKAVSRFEGPPIFTTCGTRRKTLNPLLHVPFWSPWGMSQTRPHVIKRADRAANSLYYHPNTFHKAGSRFEGPHVFTTCANHKTPKPVVPDVPFWSHWGMTQTRPHLIKRADRAAISLYSTPKHVSQGGVQIRGSSHFYYMRYSSQNPKMALLSTLLDLPVRNIWIIKVI
jgi:hypothetical protein